MKKIEFSKLNGQGNDFILIDDTAEKINLSKKQIIEMCDRNFGIGAEVSDLKMDYFNKDGSIAEMCGNGIRCMAKFAYKKELVKSKYLKIETLAGVKDIFLEIENGRVGNIKVNMGSPEFKAEKIPVKIKNQNLKQKKSL